MTIQNQSNSSKSVVLKPNYRLPILIIISGVALVPLPISTWPAILISSFGSFLLLQAFTLRLEITEKDFIVMQLGNELRRFPFKNWIAWRLLIPQLPCLLYFREKASPHLLPIIFSPNELQTQLRLRVGSLESPKEVK